MATKQIYTRVQNKHDLEVNWHHENVAFVPMQGELIIYDVEVGFDEHGNQITLTLPEGRTTPYTYERFKIGDGIHTPVGLPFVVPDHVKNITTDEINSWNTKISGTVTKEIGGISKDKVYTSATVADVLSDLLFPYVPFSFSSITTTAGAGSKEYGTSVTISKVTPTFTLGSKPITSVKIGTTSDGNDLYEGTTATSGTAITLTTSKTFNGTADGTIYCTISDGESTDTKSATVSYTYHNYVAVTSSTTAPTVASSATNRGTSAEATITTTDNTYIWFLMPNQNKTKIQQYAMNQWNNMSTTYAGSVTFTTSTGKQVTYYAYRTDKMMSATEKYRIN